MKKLILFFFLLTRLTSFAQEHAILCDTVIQVPNKTSSEIYTSVKSWIATSFKSANSIIQMDDPQNGIIVGKVCFSYTAPGGMTYRCIDGYVNYTMQLRIKDGRFKITLSDFIHETKDLYLKDTWSFGLITNREKFKMKGLQDKRYLKTWPDLQSKCLEESFLIFKSLSDSMNKPFGLEKDDDNW